MLIVEDDADAGDMLALGLGRRGAAVRLAQSGGEAMRELATAAPDLVICDLGLPDGSGLDWLAQFRSVPGAGAVPALALSGHARPIDRERSLAAGFEKHLTKPAQLADIVAAVATLVGATGDGALHPLLERLAGATGCRFTSLLRFEGDALVSVWTYDRTLARIDPFPVDMPVAASYCKMVRDARAPIAIEDAATDPRTTEHPKRLELATYVAAPVFDRDGAMFGTLCSYDPAPRTIDEAMRAAVLAAARAVETSLANA